MGRGGDPERRPFDWLAHIKLNDGLTLARWPYYYQTTHALTHRHTELHTYINSVPGYILVRWPVVV